MTESRAEGPRRRMYETKSRLLAVRLPQSLIESLDEQVANMRIESPWVSITRSDAVRWLLTLALEQEHERIVGERRAARPEADEGRNQAQA